MSLRVSSTCSRGRVGVAERVQGPLPVLGPVRSGDHPDPEVTWLDFRVVAVLQQHDPAHRAARETDLGLVIDLAFDGIKYIPVRPGRFVRPVPGREIVSERDGIAHALTEPLIGRLMISWTFSAR
jgi:hypothetical protein